MKTRVGFVSNSSTSSFLIYGITISKGHVFSLLTDEAKAVVQEKVSARGYKLEELEDYDIIDYLLWDGPLKGYVARCPYDDYYYIGKSWDKIGDNQTGKEFKKEIETYLSTYFDTSEFGTLEEAWHD